MLPVKQRNLFLECVGVPGSGKTTLAETLVSQYGFSTPPQHISLRESWSFFLKHKKICLAWTFFLLTETVQTRSWSLLRFKSAVFLNTIGRMFCAEKLYLQGNNVVLDEGFFQRLLSLYERPQTFEMFRWWCCVIAAQHPIVLVTSEDALPKKLGTYRKSLGEEYASQWFDVANHNFSMFRQSILSAKTGPAFVFLRTSDSPEALVQRIRSVAP